MEIERLEELLKEIGRMPLLSSDEETALCKAVQENGMTLMELIEVGKEGLRKGTMKYDASHGIVFIAFAVKWIRQSILHAIESIHQ